MNLPSEVIAVSDWLRLPELPLLMIANEQATGNVYRVLRVSAYLVSESDRFFLREVFGRADLADGLVSLPSVTVEEAGSPQAYRLPLPLLDGRWIPPLPASLVHWSSPPTLSLAS